MDARRFDQPSLSSGMQFRTACGAGKPYMSLGDMALYKTMREAGRSGRFKSWECGRVGCSVAIPNTVEYCSKKCFEQGETMRVNIQWQIDLTALIKRKVKIETNDGARITGRLTGVSFHRLIIDGHDIDLPTSITIDGDNAVQFTNLASIKRLPKGE